MDVYVMKHGQRRGPFQPFRLTEMLEDGELTPQDPVWHEGMEQWQPLEDTESLRNVLRKARPAHPDLDPIGPPAPAPAPNPPLPLTAAAANAANAAAAAELTPALLRHRRALAWRRFFARQIDMTISTAAVVAVATAVGWSDWWAFFMPEAWLLILAPAFLWILPEAILLTLTGTTPGRYMLGLRVLDRAGNRPSPGAALKRSVLVWAGGFGFGLPAGLLPAGLLPVAQWLYSFMLFQRRGDTLWDHSAGTQVAFCRLQRRHAGWIALFTSAVTAAYAWILFTVPIPARFSDEQRAEWEKLRKAWDRAGAATSSGATRTQPGA